MTKGPRLCLRALFSSWDYANPRNPVMVSYRAMAGLIERRIPLLAAAVLLVPLALAAACSKDVPPPIQVRDTDVVVENQTSAAWSGVEVWVNDHFRGLAPTLVAGQRLVVPLDSLVAAYGQRFDRHRQAVFGVLVKARSADGSDVRVMWGKVNRR